ncbi:MAG: hypothetical protein PHU72_05420 [Dethiosulfovibrio sp.]|nr:hypothetical protein [Dethiosulfovibrio sp.]
MTLSFSYTNSSRIKKEVSLELTALSKEVRSLSDEIGPTISGRVECKISSIMSWLNQGDLGDQSQAIMEAETLELILEVTLQRKSEQVPRKTLKSMLDRSRVISRSIRLISENPWDTI